MEREPETAGGGQIDEVDALWTQLETRVAEHLTAMADPEDASQLRIELLDGDEGGCGPYVQICTSGGGQRLQAEISANRYLQPNHHLDAREQEVLELLGWAQVDGGNWSMSFGFDEVARLAELTVMALRGLFDVPHPQLLSYVADGLGAETADRLGLAASADVRAERRGAPVAGIGTPTEPPALIARDHDELVAMVAATLASVAGEEPRVDGDGDFVLDHHGHPIWVRVLPDHPGLQVFTGVVSGVRSRRTTAGQLAVLNTQLFWPELCLLGRDVWIRISVPTYPFAPDHLRGMVGVCASTLDEVRDDLVLQTGGRAL